jgi:hypothetical protein
MRGIRTTAIVCAAVAVIAVLPASALASKALNIIAGQFGEAVTPGADFEAFQQEFNGSRFVVIKTTAGTVECRDESNHNGFSGTLLSNGQATDEVSLTGGGFEFGEACRMGEGSAFVEPTGFPWTLAIHKAGKLKVSGTPHVGFTLETSTGMRCAFTTKKLIGEASPHPEIEFAKPLVLTFDESQFKLVKGSEASCPSAANLSMELETATEGGPLFAHVAKL